MIWTLLGCWVVPIEGDDTELERQVLCETGGQFSSTELDGGRETQGHIVLDVDGDGHLDLVFNNQLDADMDFFWGDGSGSYSDFTSHSVGRSGGGFDFGDIDNDGDLDGIITNEDADALVWLEGTGDGDFGGASSISQSYFPQNVTLADLNDDGDLDIVVRLRDANCTASRLGDGDGTFAQSTCLTEYMDRTRRIDVRGDGRDEIVQNVGSTLLIHDLDSDGDIASSTTLDTTACASVSSPSVYDLDRDGLSDILVPCLEEESGDLSMLFLHADAEGHFEPCIHVEGLEHGGAIADLNGDGLADYVHSETCSFCDSIHTVYLQE